MTAASTTRRLPLPVVAAGLAAAALAAEMATGSPWAWAAPLLLGFALLLRALLGRARELTRAGLGPWVAVVSGGIIVWAIAAPESAVEVGGWLGIPVVAVGLLMLLRTRDQRTPWQRLAGGRRPLAGPVVRALAVIATGTALIVLGRWATPATAQGSAPLGDLELVILVLFAAGAIGVLDGLLRPPAGLGDLKMAAHLHDSVLQELALIQRRADDPAEVRRIARTAERDLRDWLAGRGSAGSGLLADALRATAREVEDEHPGSEIEVVVVRDLWLDERAEELLAATREALRNAARHGGGSARLFAEVSGDGAVAVYIRDTGGGFDVADAPAERRGVRDAIIGRMQAAGGSATIDSGPEGTEVTLRLPAVDGS